MKTSKARKHIERSEISAAHFYTMNEARLRLQARRRAEAVNMVFGISISLLLIVLAVMAFGECVEGLWQ